MMICPKCHNVMKRVYRFTPDKSCELNICKNCYYETKPKRIKFDRIEIIQNNTICNDRTNKKHKKKLIKKNKKRKKKKCIQHI